jgi:hypothetical protein
LVINSLAGIACIGLRLPGLAQTPFFHSIWAPDAALPFAHLSKKLDVDSALLVSPEGKTAVKISLGLILIGFGFESAAPAEAHRNWLALEPRWTAQRAALLAV